MTAVMGSLPYSPSIPIESLGLRNCPSIDIDQLLEETPKTPRASSLASLLSLTSFPSITKMTSGDLTTGDESSDSEDEEQHRAEEVEQEVDEASDDAEMQLEQVEKEHEEDGGEMEKDHVEETPIPDEIEMNGIEDISEDEEMRGQNEETQGQNEEMQGQNEEMQEEEQTTYRGPPPIEVAISFDTTGSMSSLLEPLRDNITNVCERLFADVPNLRIAIIAHGDYCDEDEFYLMKAVDFTQDFGALRTFLNETEGTGGGDFAECYEYVLNKVGQLSWTPGTKRALIMIGDAVPHEMGNPDNKLGLDWRQEVNKLYHQMGISVYSVQCKEEEGAEKFWRELADRASGRYLQLSEFDNVVQLIMAICYREKDPMMFGAFENEVRNHVGGGMTQDLHNMFEALRDDPFTPGYYPDDGATPGPSNAPVSRPNKRKRNGNVDSAGSSAKKVRKSPLKPKKAASKMAPTKKTKATKNDSQTSASSTGKNKISPLVRRQEGAVAKGKLAREHVPETRFLLREQAWSPWKLAMCKTKINCNWVPCRKGKSGYRNAKLFKNSHNEPAVYEFAIQRPGKKRYTVYMRSTQGFPEALRWDTFFFKHKSRIELADEAIRKNYKIFVRRLVIENLENNNFEVSPGKFVQLDEQNYWSKVERVAQLLFKEYDYAWCVNKYGLFTSRALKLRK